MHRRCLMMPLLLLVAALAAYADPYKLSIYYQGPPGVAREIERSFEGYRGDVLTVVPFSADTAAEMDAVAAAADVVWGGDESLHRMLRAADRVVPYRSSELASIEGAYWRAEPSNPVSGLEGMVIVYLPARLAADLVPSGWRDLVGPRWRGRLALRDPTTSLEAAGIMTRKLGWSYFEALAAQDPRVSVSDETALADLASGDALAAIVSYQSVSLSPVPVEVVWPTDASIMMPRRVAILKQEKRPAMMSGLAGQLVDYILSGEGQAVGRRYGLFPTRAGAQPPTGTPSPPAHVEAPATAADLREKLRRLFGE